MRAFRTSYRALVTVNKEFWWSWLREALVVWLASDEIINYSAQDS